MRRIEDPRIRFYLEYEEQIKEWADIKGEAHALADSFYRSLQPTLRRELEARESKSDVESFIDDDGGEPTWPTVGLRRLGWPKDDGDPDVRLQWHRRNTGFGSGWGPYCGVRAHQERYGQFFESCKESYPKTSPMWRYREIDVRDGRPERYWEADSLSEYGQFLIDELFRAWRDFAPLIDKAVGSGTK